MNILEVENLQRSFGGQIAVDGLTMEVETESITGIIGPNGSGKSTTFNLITGMLDPDDGTVQFESEDITDWNPYDIAQAGLGRTFQQARVFEEMTVLENMVAVEAPADDVYAEAEKLLDFVELDDERDSFAGELSGGQQVLLGIARMLMLDPKLVLLDEPFAGVNPGLVEDIKELLEELRTEEDKTVLIIDHEIDEISELCDELIVLVEGQQLMKDTPETVRQNERVRKSYLGV